MKRTAAVTAIIFGVLAIAFATSSYIHLRNLAFASPPVDASQYFDFRILSAGMRDTANANVIDAAAFARQLTFRIYAIGGTGVAFILIGGSLFVLLRNSQHEPTPGSSSPTTRLVAG